MPGCGWGRELCGFIGRVVGVGGTRVWCLWESVSCSAHRVACSGPTPIICEASIPLESDFNNPLSYLLPWEWPIIAHAVLFSSSHRMLHGPACLRHITFPNNLIHPSFRMFSGAAIRVWFLVSIPGTGGELLDSDLND